MSDSTNVVNYILQNYKDGNVKYEEQFKKFDPSKKWYLSAGKCVYDELFLLGLQCKYDHPSRSYIMDPYDENYVIYYVKRSKQTTHLVLDLTLKKIG
jgi:hypothetical protein